MSRVTKVTTTILATLVMLGGALAQSTDAQASVSYKRSKITNVKKGNYYSIKNAKTYKMIGSAKKIHLKANHNLKNYKNSTLVKTKKTTITKHGKKYLYYYVTSQKNGAKGWVWHKYLKAGKNYQMSNVKNLKPKNYIRVKSGNIYQLQGSNKYMKFTNGKAISSKKTYKVTQQRHIYKNGKTYKYYYVISGKTSGWTWNKYLKAGTYHAPVQNSASQATSSSSQASSSASQSSSQAGLSSSKPTEPTKPAGNDKTYNATTLANNVITQVNSERVKFTATNTQAVTTDATLTTIANIRAKQLAKDFNHLDANGQAYVEPIAKQYGVWGSVYGTEDIGTDAFIGSNQQTANAIIESVKGYKGHWGDLMNAGYTKIGVGFYNAPDGTLYIAIEMGF